MIPSEVEELLRSVSFWFSNSPKRFAEYLEVVRYLNLPPLKMLKVQFAYPALINYFTVEAFEMSTFSDVNEVKDLKGNKTSTALLNSCCFLKSYGQAYNINSHNFTPTENQLPRY
ncbi:hypothetical protein TSAR_003259 [Trichomalopsis sarcophagae]|uniref:Uncharacterized protein n=1 Tax=Trichomalopsis sarcophagae TaxID=543379 RepID=A0A232ELL4_9HYME|nr:hypothetical protein TSAR_003259 [Trichomalopsis sarcophagae]